MKKYLSTIIIALIVIALSVLGFVLGGISLSDNQLYTLYILLIICGISVTYCFIVGELAHNNSQMDKLWSILPIVYVWVVAIRGGMSVRLIIYAIITTLWGIRLTFNFARKGAYRLKFWEGEEDYRWAILRKSGPLSNRYMWMLFNFFFICLYQNALVLAMTLPALAVMDSLEAFGTFDYLATFTALFFLILETVADEQQWKFHQKKKQLLNQGKPLEEIDPPYNLGFNTTGLWGYARHPNYLGEQGIWICLYLFTISAGVNSYGVFNWSMFGPLFIVLLFAGSSMFGENISNNKYPNYKYYLSYVSKYIPFRKFNLEKAKAKYREK